MDCHPYFHIAHSNFWVDKNGNHPKAFTTITHSMFEAGEYSPVLASLRPRVDDYLITLENQGRYQLTIWPDHCMIGTKGMNVYPEIWESLNFWEKSRPGNIINYVMKSKNPLTEHYSAIKAEVQDPADATTRTNYELIERIKKDDMIFVAGEALSHCVANTLRDLFIYLQPKRVSLIRDCTSTISEYEKIGEEFLKEFVSKGMNLVNSTESI